MLSTCQDYATQGYLVFALHSVPDYDKSVRSGLSIWDQVIRLIIVAKVDLVSGNEFVNINCMSAFEFDRLELIFLDLDVLPLRELIAASAIFLIDFPARDFVDKLLPETMAVIPIYLVEMRFLGRGRRWI